jgi:hypothetical protein
MRPRRSTNLRQIMVVCITVAALCLGVWAALWIATPSSRSRVTIRGSENVLAPVDLQALQMSHNQETGELTIVTRDREGNMGRVRVPLKEVVPLGTPSTAASIGESGETTTETPSAQGE